MAVARFTGSLWDWQPDDHIVRDYREWRTNNPDVYALFVKFSRELLHSGRRHYGAKALMERVRWHVQIERREEFKVNNNFTALIARDLMSEGVVPDGFFELRTRRAR